MTLQLSFSSWPSPLPIYQIRELESNLRLRAKNGEPAKHAAETLHSVPKAIKTSESITAAIHEPSLFPLLHYHHYH